MLIGRPELRRAADQFDTIDPHLTLSIVSRYFRDIAVKSDFETMKENLSKSLICRLKSFHVFYTTAALVLVLALFGCSDSAYSGLPERAGSDDLSLVWEAWDKIGHKYVGSGDINAETAVSGAMSKIMALIDIEPYPFLTEVGRLRGQSPGHVPSELVDLWRAVSVYLSSNPELDPSTIAEAAVSGLVGGLGHSSAVFLNASQYPLAKESLEGGMEGSYLGIGSRVISRNGQIVLFPFAGSPAARAGVLPEDVLVAVGGTLVAGQNVEAVVNQIAGPKGTKVKLEVIRIGEPEGVVLEVFRGDIELQSVASQLMPGGIAYLRISRFRDNTGEQVFSALEALNRFDLLALVLDIRTNPGGSSEAAIVTAGQFMPEGTVFGYT